MSDFCILIPTINRYDLLKEALSVYPEVYPDVLIFVLDSGNQGITEINNTLLFRSERRMGVASSWNYLVRKAIERGFSRFLILNDDIILKSGQDMISRLIASHDNMTFLRPRPIYNWSAFILSKAIFEIVGEFDENFVKCFFEDNDYEYRMKLKKIPVVYCDALNPEVYRNSMTTQKEPLLGDYIANQDYYIGKWGGIPGSEIYLTPQNR